jgi:transcriptional regulator with XRE-family HTH domain
MPRGRKTQPDYPGSLGSLLYDKRKANGWPARKVAYACGLSQTFIAAIERGARCPELDRVPEIARAYRLNVSLVCWTWIVQFAPRAAPYMVRPAYAHTLSDSEVETAISDSEVETAISDSEVETAISDSEVETAISDSEIETAMLLGMSASRWKVEAEVAELRRQGMVQVTRDPGTTAQEQARADERQAMLDAPLPEVAPSEPPMGSVIVGDRHENHPETSSGSGKEYIKDREICKEHQNN